MDRSEQISLDKASMVSDSHVVFQCESCRSILGDATTWISAEETLESFTLSAVTECVTVGETLHHSTHAHDAGSSFFSLTCTNCKTELGRRYLTTPSHLDHLRDHFTLHVAMVTSYQLGSAKVKAMSENKGQELPLLVKVAERCMKLQHLVLSLNERLCTVERFLQEGEEGQDPDPVDKNGA
ncbi:protein Mis18-alpha-like [Babylonia areolata]|uniref:protein Mis18-alpha-like n=1 Tax=Babylonia areolata TaxID=304850 RepID=UPI003FCF0B7A